MWTAFKIINVLWLFISTYWWITAGISQGPILIAINVLMMICMSFLPIKVDFNSRMGKIIICILLVGLWTIYIDGAVMGLVTMMMYLPVLYLLQLPFGYQEDLLNFTTKWYSILISIGLVMYWATLFFPLPSIGTFVHPPYPPYLNHIFYIESTFDYGTFVRFNACFLEPGHQSILSTFLIIANKFRFKENPWLWPLVLAIIFSFSLAGYLLILIGYAILKVNSVGKGLAVAGTVAVVVIGAINWSGGENALYELIISRLEQDEKQGIKGNNRFYNDTDFVYSQAVKNGNLSTGVKNSVNMDLVGGAGYKIYIINYGLIGVLLTLLLYISLIPPKPDYRYTIGFLIVIALCFLQRAYPVWYSWLFPYVIGIYTVKGEKDALLLSGQDNPPAEG